MAPGEITLTEIQSQPQMWAEALRLFAEQEERVTALWTQGGFDQVIFTGCGSTYYLGVIGATLLQAMTGVIARAFSASELMLFPRVNFQPKQKTLLVCVSRSGTTRETVEAAHRFRRYALGSVLVVTCQSDSPLAQEADLVLAIDAAQERSRVQTRSFSSMMVTVAAIAAAFGGQDWRVLKALPDALERLLAKSEAAIRPLGEDTSITQFAFLGSGPQQGLATEAMLKMTEMSRVFSVSYHILEYLHGPRYATDPNTLLVALISDNAYAEEVPALKPAAWRGARTLILAEADRGDALAEAGTLLTLDSGLPEWARTILYLPPLQLLGWHQAIQRGFDPDRLQYDPRFPA